MQDPREGHYGPAMHILRYLKSSPGQRILLSSADDLSLRAYCDSDGAGCPMTRRSTAEYILMLGSTPLLYILMLGSTPLSWKIYL